MEISWLQAMIFALLAACSGMIGGFGQPYGWYTLSRPLVAAVVVGLIMGDLKSAIILGAAMQVAYIAIVTPGGTLAIDLRSICWIGIPLALAAVKGADLDAGSPEATGLAVSIASTVGILGTLASHGTLAFNTAVSVPFGMKGIDEGNERNMLIANFGIPVVAHMLFAFVPTLLVTKFGVSFVSDIQSFIPLDSLIMKTLFSVGNMLATVGIALLLRHIVRKGTDFIPFLFGFTLASVLGVSLIGCTIIAVMFATIALEAGNDRSVVQEDAEEDI